MPIYEFECEKCGKVKEHYTSSHKGNGKLTCDCGGSLKKIISQSSFILKGSGWYATDYANKGKKEIKSEVCNSCEKKPSCPSSNNN